MSSFQAGASPAATLDYHRNHMRNYLSIAQIAIAILMMAAILMQSRGTGLGAAFGGEGNVYRTKRGVEKSLFITTIVLAVAFFGLSLAAIFLPAASA
jgi:preprotein translocase subunit SecG